MLDFQSQFKSVKNSAFCIYKMEKMWIFKYNKLMKFLNIYLQGPSVFDNFNKIVKLQLLLFLNLLLGYIPQFLIKIAFNPIITLHIPNIEPTASNFLTIFPFHPTLINKIHMRISVVHFITYLICHRMTYRIQLLFLCLGQ